MTEREKFEAWWEEWFGDKPLSGWESLRCDNGYAAEEIDNMWDAWRAATASTQEQMAALACENAALKSFGDKLDEMHNDLNGEGTGIQGRAEVACQQVALEAAIDEFNVIKTPVTDAFIAELQATKWTEGNEPTEFGRYWVRYNTDVGPQYCSAKWMRHNFCAGSDTNIHNIWLADHSRSLNPLRGVTHYTKLPDSLELSQQLRDEVKP